MMMAITKKGGAIARTAKTRRNHAGGTMLGRSMNRKDGNADRIMMLSEQHLTFAGMLRLQRDQLARLKLPPWIFALRYKRHDQATLSETQRERFLCALNVLIANGTYGQLVDLHAGMYMQHTNDRLLPWHRIFLLQ